MHLAYGWHKRVLLMSRSVNYTVEELEALLHRRAGPHWLVVEGTAIRLERPDWVTLACRAVALDHNAYTVIPDDGFARDMARRERAAVDHMLAESSSDEEGSVTSAEDMVYEREAYI